MKKLATIFLLAFFANFIWEYLHASLYLHYQGDEISEFVLLRAALFDAAFITILGLLFLRARFLREHLWLALVIGVAFAVGLERWALATGRWAYAPAMPIIPFLQIGLSPTIQLGLLSYLIFWVVIGKNRETK